MSLATIAAGIDSVVAGVTDIGVTFDHNPVPKNDWATYVDAFSTTVAGYQSGARHIRAWTLAYLGEQRERRVIGIGGSAKVDRHTRWMVRGFLSWADPDSDAAFRTLVETVTTALDEARTLGSVVSDHSPVLVDLPNNASGVLFGDILCHYAELTFTAKAEDTLTQS